MPGMSHAGALPTITKAQSDLADELQLDVTHLAEDIGERDLRHTLALDAAAEYLDPR